MSIIELENIYFAYDPDGEDVLSDFSLKVEAGECLIVKGDNGSGKTTLFRIICGLSFPYRGKYLSDGVEITEKHLKNSRNSKLFHKKTGFLFQNPDVMLFNGNVYDEIAFGPRQMGLDDKETDERVNDCMKLLQIENLGDKAPYHLSGGQKKRVALGAVLSLNPDIIILDEPFAGLDSKGIALFTAIFRELKAAGKTLIIATHSEELTKEIGDREIILG